MIATQNVSYGVALVVKPEGVVFKHVGFPWTNIQIPAVFIFPLKLHNRLGQNLVCVPSYI